VLVDAAQDLGAVDLPDHDLLGAHAGGRVEQAPAVAVEHRQRVEVDVAVGQRRVPAERRRVDPAGTVRLLDALGAGGGAGGVVDRGGRILVGLPLGRLGARRPDLVVVTAQDEDVLRCGAGLGEVLQFGVQQDDLGAAVTDDVLDLGRCQAEVHRHEDASPVRDAVERGQQAGGVVGNHRHAGALGHSQLVERRRLAARLRVQLGVRDLAPGVRHLVRLVDHGHSAGVDGAGAVEEVAQGQRDDHGASGRRVAVSVWVTSRCHCGDSAVARASRELADR
jgi:hypothetical protein